MGAEVHQGPAAVGVGECKCKCRGELPLMAQCFQCAGGERCSRCVCPQLQHWKVFAGSANAAGVFASSEQRKFAVAGRGATYLAHR